MQTIVCARCRHEFVSTTNEATSKPYKTCLKCREYGLNWWEKHPIASHPRNNALIVYRPIVCALEGCGMRFRPGSSTAHYCSPGCLHQVKLVKDRKDHAKHREGRNKKRLQRQRDHPKEHNLVNHKYRALKAGNGGSYTTEELDALWHAQNGFCFYCGDILYKTLNSKYHV